MKGERGHKGEVGLGGKKGREESPRGHSWGVGGGERREGTAGSKVNTKSIGKKKRGRKEKLGGGGGGKGLHWTEYKEQNLGVSSFMCTLQISMHP